MKVLRSFGLVMMYQLGEDLVRRSLEATINHIALSCIITMEDDEYLPSSLLTRAFLHTYTYKRW